MGHKDAYYDISMYMWLYILVDIISCSLQMSRLPVLDRRGASQTRGA